MKFLVLGSGTALPDPDRGSAGFAITVDGHTWGIDGGSGTLQRAARFGTDPTLWQGGFYSHRHPDHIGDLGPLLFAMRVARRQEPYRIFGARGLHDHVTKLRALWGRHASPGRGGLCVEEFPLSGPHAVRIGGMRVVAAPANHGAGAVHLRFEHRHHSVVFSGDTGPSKALIRLARDTDLLVCECASARDAPVPGHLTPEDVADVVRIAKPHQVWLTHVYPQHDRDRALRVVAATGVPTRLAQDGDLWSVGTP